MKKTCLSNSSPENYSLLERLSFSSPKECKKLCVKAVNRAINDVCGAVMPNEKYRKILQNEKQKTKNPTSE